MQYERFSFLKLRAPIEVHILFAKQFYRHVIDRIDFFLQYDGLEESVNTRIALKKSMLGYEKGYTATSETIGVFAYHIVSHNLYVTPVGAQQKVAHDMGLRT